MTTTILIISNIVTIGFILKLKIKNDHLEFLCERWSLRYKLLRENFYNLQIENTDLKQKRKELKEPEILDIPGFLNSATRMFVGLFPSKEISLEDRLKTAIENEDYELAKSIQEQINKKSGK
jgi:hypothetical protein